MLNDLGMNKLMALNQQLQHLESRFDILSSSQDALMSIGDEVSSSQKTYEHNISKYVHFKSQLP